MRGVIYFTALIIILWGCESKNEKKEISSVNEVEKIDFTDGNNVLLDVRSPEEFAEGHLPNAVNLDVNGTDFEGKIRQLDTLKTYYVYCKSGVRSTKACGKMEASGFKHLVNLRDGYSAYKK